MTNAELRVQFQCLVGSECWSVIAGAGTGSTMHLAFGAKIPRTRPVRNDMLLAVERAYEGEIDLFVECACRLERLAEVLCGSTDDDRNDGPMVRGLSRLIGRSVAGIDVLEPIPDLVLRFDEGLCLRLFCDQTNVETDYDNYSLRIGDTILAIGARGTISSRSVRPIDLTARRGVEGGVGHAMSPMGAKVRWSSRFGGRVLSVSDRRTGERPI